MSKTHKVLLMRCASYDPGKISGIIKEGMQELGVKPYGRIMLKPNVVIAQRDYFPHAFTRSEFLDGALEATKYHAENIKEISVGERSGITIPTRFSFKNAHYPQVIKKHKAKTYYFDEEKQVPVELKHEKAIRNNIFIPKSLTQTDFLINLPKFKAHPWTRMTLSLKNYIGIQDDRHRLVDHNQFLEHKIADLQEVIPSKFIAVDSIIAGEKMMLTPDPFLMGVIMLGTNSCAIDTVGCHMVNIDPTTLIHLKKTAERGYGPIDINDIDVSGDFPLEELQHQNKDFQFCLERIDDYFNGESNLTCTVGTFPEKHSKDYCWGGCPGSLQEAIHIYKTAHPDVLKKIKKIRYVVGQVEGDLDLQEDERVLFAGDCTSYKGKLNGSFVTINSTYKTSSEVNERETKSNDMFKRTFITMKNVILNRNKRYLRAKGCPVSVADHVHYISGLGGIPNMNFHPKLMLQSNLAYLQMRIRRFFNTLF
jgi:uncharacterized protein (DUF362 family)